MISQDVEDEAAPVRQERYLAGSRLPAVGLFHHSEFDRLYAECARDLDDHMRVELSAGFDFVDLAGPRSGMCCQLLLRPATHQACSVKDAGDGIV